MVVGVDMRLSTARYIFVTHILQRAHLNYRPHGTWQESKLSRTERTK
jgi:hypothetical protein